MSSISSLVIPIIVFTVVLYGAYKKIDIYDSFIKGAKEGMGIAIDIFPFLLGMMLAVNIILKSNIIQYGIEVLKPVLNFLMIPSEIVPLSLIRPISANASLSILNGIYASYGPDSFIGYIVSVIQGSTDTTIYILTLYFGSIGIKKIKHALWVGLLCDFMTVLISVFVVNMLFGM